METIPKVGTSMYHYGGRLSLDPKMFGTMVLSCLQYYLYDFVKTDHLSPRIKYIKKYLNLVRNLQDTSSSEAVIHSYESTTKNMHTYDYLFAELTLMAGWCKLKFLSLARIIMTWMFMS